MDHGSWGARWVGRSGHPVNVEQGPSGGFVLARGGLGRRPHLRGICHGAPMPGSYRHAEINGSAAAARTADFGRPLLGPNRFDHDTFPFRVQNLDSGGLVSTSPLAVSRTATELLPVHLLPRHVDPPPRDLRDRAVVGHRCMDEAIQVPPVASPLVHGRHPAQLRFASPARIPILGCQ